MVKKISQKQLGAADHGWLRSIFHFSFADYYNPDNMNFGTLRVLNDDLVSPGHGFDLHPHRDMEIISYIVNGELTHQDSMNNKRTLKRGAIQYMSAGTGVMHSEHNYGRETLRFVQIWIPPVKKGLHPNYGDFEFAWEDRVNAWLHMVSPINGTAPVKIHQDANVYSLSLEAGKTTSFALENSRQAYLVQIEGGSNINGLALESRDALEAVEESLSITAGQDSHFLLIEMAKA